MSIEEKINDLTIDLIEKGTILKSQTVIHKGKEYHIVVNVFRKEEI